MKLCMMTYTMARQGYEIDDFIRTAVKNNLTGIDWVTTYGCDPKELKMRSNDAGLTVACHTFMCSKLIAGEERWLDQVKQSVEDAFILGAPIVMIPTGCNAEISRDEFRKFWIDALLEIAPVTDDAGIILTVENFPGSASAFITAADYYEAKAAIPQLKLTYDNGNAEFGENTVESFTASVPDVVHAHFKDWDIINHPEAGYRDSLVGKYFKPALISQGNLDTVGCWNAMRKAGYDGYINIEYEGNKIPADEAIAIAAEYLRSL